MFHLLFQLGYPRDTRVIHRQVIQRLLHLLSLQASPLLRRLVCRAENLPVIQPANLVAACLLCSRRLYPRLVQLLILLSVRLLTPLRCLQQCPRRSRHRYRLTDLVVFLLGYPVGTHLVVRAVGLLVNRLSNHQHGRVKYPQEFHQMYLRDFRLEFQPSSPVVDLPRYLLLAPA